MLTPQDISEKRFVKAVFGGYDMAGVDEFLETVSNDYSAMYKENAILKGKLKVLVEKVEEYRSTEDAMRMALLTAQRMGEEITIEANKAKEEMLRSADEEVRTKLAETTKRIAQEELRLAAASKETAKFLELSQAIIRKHAEFLKKLEAANQSVKPAVSRITAEQAQPAEAAQPQPDEAAMQQPPEAPPPVMPTPAPMPIPTPAVKVSSKAAAAAPPPPETPGSPADFDIAQQIGSAVAEMTSSIPSPDAEAGTMTAAAADNIAVPQEAPVPAAPDTPPMFDNSNAADDPPVDVSPRPKFDFDDLKFGANFDNDD